MLGRQTAIFVHLPFLTVQTTVPTSFKPTPYRSLPFNGVRSGQQTIFSKVVGQQTGGSVPSHGRVFENNQQTTGADIARDNGYSAWLDASPPAYLDLELGYTHSDHYDLNTVSFSVGINLGHLAERPAAMAALANGLVIDFTSLKSDVAVPALTKGSFQGAQKSLACQATLKPSYSGACTFDLRSRLSEE